MKNLVSMLRLVAIVEGLSLLTLFFIAMPLKYQYGNTDIVPIVGMTHGILFMVFVAFALYVSQRKAWSDGFLALLILSSIVPFATFVMDRKLKTLQFSS